MGIYTHTGCTVNYVSETYRFKLFKYSELLLTILFKYKYVYTFVPMSFKFELSIMYNYFIAEMF